MKPIIAVCGSDGDDPQLTSNSLSLAETIGRLIAQHNAVLLCGGRGGIMQAACKGAKEAGGITVGILPLGKDEANEYVDIALPTGLGNKRNYLIVSAADAIIGIAGRWGTLNEISYAMILAKPVVLIRGTGGCADWLLQNRMHSSSTPNLVGVDSAQAAIDMVFSLFFR